MRKIASNYVYLPGYGLKKNACVSIENKQIIGVEVFESGVIEIEGVEFYGGMIVPSFVYGNLNRHTLCIFDALDDLYGKSLKTDNDLSCGLAVIEALDFNGFLINENMRITLIY